MALLPHNTRGGDQKPGGFPRKRHVPGPPCAAGNAGSQFEKRRAGPLQARRLRPGPDPTASRRDPEKAHGDTKEKQATPDRRPIALKNRGETGSL